MNRILIILIITLLISFPSFSQKSQLKDIDSELTMLYRNFSKTFLEGNLDKKDSLGDLFEKQLIRHLLNPATFYYSLDSLSQYVAIVSSTDERIKFYSWSNLNGGSYQEIYSIAQFSNSKGEVIVQNLYTSKEKAMNPENWDPSLRVEKVIDIPINNQNSYLTVSWGTYTRGVSHYTLRVFKILGDSLVKTRSFYSGTDLVMHYPRFINNSLNLAINDKEYTIGFNDFDFEGRKSGNRFTLKLENGFFKLWATPIK